MKLKMDPLSWASHSSLMQSSRVTQNIFSCFASPDHTESPQKNNVAFLSSPKRTTHAGSGQAGQMFPAPPRKSNQHRSQWNSHIELSGCSLSPVIPFLTHSAAQDQQHWLP